MPAPLTATYSVDAFVAAHTAFRDLIDAGLAAGSIKIRDAADVLLANVPLSYPCGAVDGVTGRLTFAIAGPDLAADAGGVAAYGEFCDSAGAVKLSLPAVEGPASIAGKLVLNTTTIVVGQPVSVAVATVG